MADAAERILTEIGALRGQLDRVEKRMDRLEGLSVQVAVLERQDQHDRDAAARIESRIVQLETGQRALARLDHLEAQVTATRDSVAKIADTLATKASAPALAAEAARITALETDGHKREGMSRAGMLLWSALVALPGLVGLFMALAERFR